MPDNKDDVRKGYNYPNEVRDAIIVEKYSESTFSIHAMEDFCDMLSYVSANHKPIIDNFFAKGGIVEHDRDENGAEIPNRYLFYIGNTLLFFEFNNDFEIVDMGIHWDLKSNYRNRDLDTDLSMILQTATAILYRDRPGIAIEWLRSKETDVWSADMVRGLQKRADKITENEMVSAFFFAGANIETLDKFQNFIANRATPPTTDKKTEYGDI